MKKSYLLPIFIFLCHTIWAQSENDIVRYSVTPNNGSARVSAMGGAFGALGGDLSNTNNNPAGIGVFRRSEVNFTPYFNIANTTSNGISIGKNSFQMGNLGMVTSFYLPNANWRGYSFGINYSNLNNFHRKTNQFVYDSPTNFPTALANQATIAYLHGDNMPTDSELGYNVRLIEWIEKEGKYDANLIAGELVNQQKYIVEEGYQGTFDFSFGANYQDILYLGASIGIQSIRYEYRSTYTEIAPLDSYYEINAYDYRQFLTSEGVGTNFKAGVIFRPIPELRLGASIHTPTYFSFSEDYEADMHSQFFTKDEDGQNSYYDSTPLLHYTYDMQTPWKTIFSIATVLGQKAILSLDYEFNNYKSAKFSDNEGNYDYSAINQNINKYLTNTHNVRIGAEFRVNSLFSLRTGYAYWASPYRYSSAGEIQSVSGGVGLNFGGFYCDAAYVYQHAANTTHFYEYLDPEDSIYDVIANPIKNKYNNHEIKFTLGFRF